MAALQCEICGGKLIGKPGGVFECDSCGMEYSTEWARAKVQEIKGTVKIEGPVEVTGTVKVEGGPSVESLLKRGWMALADDDPKRRMEAPNFFNQALNLDAECAEAYLVLALSKKGYRTWEQVLSHPLESLREDIDFQRARKYAKPDLSAKLDKLDDVFKKKAQTELQKMPRLEEYRKHIAPAAHLISLNSEWSILGVRPDGTVKCYDDDYFEDQTDIVGVYRDYALRSDGIVLKDNDTQMNWTNIVKLAVGKSSFGQEDRVVGIRKDGTAITTITSDGCDVSKWSDIISAAVNITYDGHVCIIGLKSDGTVLTTGYDNADYFDDVRGWSDIVEVAAGEDVIIGLKSNGRVVCSGPYKKDYSALEEWTDIVSIAAGSKIALGLKENGTVAAVTRELLKSIEVDDWKHIIAIDTALDTVIGLRTDGTVVGTEGIEFEGKLFSNYEKMEQERLEMKRRKDKEAAQKRREAEETRAKAEAERQAKIAALEAEKASIQAELPTLKGLFSGGKRRELETRLAQIEKELSAL